MYEFYFVVCVVAFIQDVSLACTKGAICKNFSLKMI